MARHEHATLSGLIFFRIDTSIRTTGRVSQLLRLFHCPAINRPAFFGVALRIESGTGKQKLQQSATRVRNE